MWNATYGEYTVGGDALFRAHHNDSWEWMGNGKWQEMRTINSPGRTSQNGDNHYGMSDYYPWNPDGRGCACVSCHDIAGIWVAFFQECQQHRCEQGGTPNVPPQGQQALWDSAGALASWDGLDFLSMARPAEFAAGDRFFSPFIACGWVRNCDGNLGKFDHSLGMFDGYFRQSEKEEMNLRPSQDLAILKGLMAAGAEYIHVGQFNGVGRGANWVWQTVMPVYSQGVATAVADLWRHSTLLEGDMPLPVYTCCECARPEVCLRLT